MIAVDRARVRREAALVGNVRLALRCLLLLGRQVLIWGQKSTTMR